MNGSRRSLAAASCSSVRPTKPLVVAEHHRALGDEPDDDAGEHHAPAEQRGRVLPLGVLRSRRCRLVDASREARAGGLERVLRRRRRGWRRCRGVRAPLLGSSPAARAARRSRRASAPSLCSARWGSRVVITTGECGAFVSPDELDQARHAGEQIRATDQVAGGDAFEERVIAPVRHLRGGCHQLHDLELH